MIKDLKLARKLFMREHKNVFKILGAMQDAYYKSDERRGNASSASAMTWMCSA